tara:strand:+ start:458 stop:568 length:111 start_codon:yes stop_codon:yes gene_type:complete
MFVWATKDGQFEDLDTPGSRILFEDEDLKEYDDSRS